MKTLLLIFTSFFALSLFGQVENKKTIFKTSYFNNDGQVTKSIVDTISTNESISIDFYKKHFYVPYYFPQPFINKLYKDTTIIIWQDILKAKDYETNWTYTTVYDKKFRAIKYTYSGCLICGQFPFNVDIFYDNKSRPTRIRKNYGIGFKEVNKKLRKDIKKVADNEDALEYNENDEIIKVKSFKRGKLESQIDKI
ncbi:MAG: hypothetical protein QM535_18365 [Limnohabitans sp.]|nr:hypothetical protein [Limnohabitans sp.]